MSQNKIQRGSSALAIKAGFWYVVSTFLVRAATFITTPIFSRLMTQSDYGEFSNFASWQVFLLIITGAELYNTLNRAYYDYEDDYDSYVSTVTLMGFGITLVVYVLFLLCRGFIFNIVSIPEKYVHLLFFLLLFQCSKQIFLARERVFYRVKSVAVLSAVNLLVPTVISIFLVVVLPEADRLDSRIYGYYVPSAIIGMFCAIPLIKSIKKIKFEYCKYAIVLAIPLLAQYLTTFLLTTSNTIIAKTMLGAASAAIVSIAASTIHLLTYFFQAVSGAFTTWLMDNLEQKEQGKARKGTLAYVCLLALVAGGVILISPEVVLILGSKKYMAPEADAPTSIW